MRLSARRCIILVALFLGGILTMCGSARAEPFVTKWGKNGTGDGEFDEPWGIAINGSGFVYVTDSFNHRVQVFTSTGQFVTKWGSYGTTGDGYFNGAYGIAVNATGYVYVADGDNSRIQVFTSTGQFVRKWGSPGSGDGYFGTIHGLAVNATGHVFVADPSYSRVQVFTSTGQFVTKWSCSFPVGIAINKTGFVYVTGFSSNDVKVYTSTGQFLFGWGQSGSVGGSFNKPRGIAINGTGYVFVADRDNYRVQVFTSAGQFLNTWGTSGAGDGQFSYLNGVATNQTGYIFTTEFSNHRVQVFQGYYTPNLEPNLDWVLWAIIGSIAVLVAVFFIVRKREWITTHLTQIKEKTHISRGKAPHREEFVNTSLAASASRSCVRCGALVPPESVFCLKCGTKLDRHCPLCNAPIPTEALFCGNCGGKVDTRPLVMENAPPIPPPAEETTLNLHKATEPIQVPAIEVLSKEVVQTLSTIALQQPIPLLMLVSRRGPDAFEHVQVLKDLGLIRTLGKGDTADLVTTDQFAMVFGLNRDVKKMQAELRENLDRLYYGVVKS